MNAISKCYMCGSEVHQKSVTEMLEGGGNTLSLETTCLVCTNCGERYYTLSDVRKMDELEAKLSLQGAIPT